MLQRILVATDFSAAARRALARAAELARQSRAELTVVHVLPERGVFERLLHRREADHAAIASGAGQALHAALEALEQATGVRPASAILEGAAHRVIGEAASAYGSDLVVIGARGENESAVARPSLGGTALKCLATTERPLLLVRRAVAGPYQEVLAAVDNSAASRAVLAWALELGRAARRRRALHAFEAPFASRLRAREVAESALDVYAREQRAHAERALAALAEQLGAGGRLETMAVRGEPTTTILQHIEEHGSDLLVIGKRGHRPRELTPESYGSVSLRLAFDAPLDVLIVP